MFHLIQGQKQRSETVWDTYFSLGTPGTENPLQIGFCLTASIAYVTVSPVAYQISVMLLHFISY